MQMGRMPGGEGGVNRCAKRGWVGRGGMCGRTAEDEDFASGSPRLVSTLFAFLQCGSFEGEELG